MATLSVGSSGEDSGWARLSGLSADNTYARQAYFTATGGGDSFTEGATIPKGSTSNVTVYFDGLSPGTTYRVTYSVYRNGSIIAQDTNGKTFTTDAALNEPFEFSSGYVELDSYDVDTGYAYVTAYATFYNPNGVRVYGRASMYLESGSTEGSTYNSSNQWVSSYGTFTISKQYYWYVGGAFPKTFYIYGNGHCYQEQGSTSGGMVSSGWDYDTDTLTLSRPSKFYWISSSQNLQSGQAISTYITATKWKALQTNINGVRAYKGLSAYSFSAASKGSPITAALYNEIVYAVNGIKSGTLSTVTKNVTPITASVMNALQNGINGIS